MGILELLRKIADGQELSDAERQELREYKEPDTGATARIAAKRAKQLEQELKDAQAAAEAAQEALEAASVGGSELEKLKRQHERLAAKHAEAEKLIEIERQGHETTKRAAALGRIEVPWLPDVSGKYRDMTLQEAFEDFATEDLADAGKVGKVVERIITDNSRFVSASAKSGAGTGADEGSTNGASARQGAQDWSQPIDWRALERSGGQKAVTEKLDTMWAEPAPS